MKTECVCFGDVREHILKMYNTLYYLNYLTDKTIIKKYVVYSPSCRHDPLYVETKKTYDFGLW